MTLFTNSIIVAVCIDIMLMIGFLTGGIGTSTNNICGSAITTFFNIDSTNNKITANENLTSAIPTSTATGSFGTVTQGTTTQFSFIDGLKMVFAVLLLPIAMVFTPLCTGLALGFPIWLQLLVSVPLTFGTLFGLIYLIRGIAG